MGLKAVLENLDGQNEATRAFYKAGNDGKFYLEIDGVEDLPAFGGMRRAKEQERDAHNATTGKLNDATNRVKQLQDELDEIHRGNISKGDMEKLENSWRGKLVDLETKLTGERDGLRAQVNELLVDNVALGLATEISTAPELMLPHITKRLTAETVNGKLVTRVLDAEGKLSAATLEDLKTEFLQSKTFAAIIVGSKASGSGASGGSGGGGATKKFSELSEADRSALYRQDPEKYRQLRDADKK